MQVYDHHCCPEIFLLPKPAQTVCVLPISMPLDIFFPFFHHFTAFCNPQGGINKIHFSPAKEENLSFDFFSLPCDFASLVHWLKENND